MQCVCGCESESASGAIRIDDIAAARSLILVFRLLLLPPPPLLLSSCQLYVCSIAVP